MRPPLAARLSRALVACYPPRWKQRYREEMLDVLDQHRASPRTVLSFASTTSATGPAAHEALRLQQTTRAHRTQAPIMLNLK